MFILNILIDLCLIFAVWRLSKNKSVYWNKHIYKPQSVEVVRVPTKEFDGRLTKMYIAAKVAEKTAERAFNMASSATLSCIAIQKSLQTPKIMTKKQLEKNLLAKTQVDKILGDDDMFTWLRPVLGEEENEVLDQVLEEKRKAEYNGDMSKEKVE